MPKDFTSIYKPEMSPEVLADNVLRYFFGTKMPSLPIDPFKMMKDLHVIYQFMDFKDLEGIYFVPKNSDDIAVVGINFNRPITRQRFSAAHELCHHLKDRQNEYCPKSFQNNNPIERYAENFAAALLMPWQLLKEVASSQANNNNLDLEDVLFIAEKFGVSFRSCALRLAYDLKMLPYENSQELNKQIQRFKPDRKKQELGIDRENIELVKQAINSYPFLYSMEKTNVWYQFKNHFIYNENRMEGVDLEENEVAEIVTDLRMQKQNSEYCKTEYKGIIEVAGHSAIYDYIFETTDTLSIYKLINLNQQLFQYAPCPDVGGKTRQSNNYVLGAKFETSDYRTVGQELVDLQNIFNEIIADIDQYDFGSYIDKISFIHHRITQIHPFADGNGRCARAFLNWMLKLKGLPPIYIKFTRKEKYYAALKKADTDHQYKELTRIIIQEIFRTMLKINNKPSFIYHNQQDGTTP